jgi:nucleoside-diphosphate-sugar epimerase
MGRILIAGCGYLGEAVADLFSDSGWEIEGWTASQSSAAKFSDKPYAVRAVDITDRNQLGAQPKNFDAVIHCASTSGGAPEVYRRVYFEGARNLLEQFGGSTILFTSSTSVYAQNNREWVTEESPAEPKHDSGKILRKTEELVLRRGGIVARLAGIYGPGRAALLTKFLRGEAIFDPDNDRFVNEGHRDDIASALFLLLDREVARGHIFNVADDKPILQSDCYRFLARKLNKPFPPRGKSDGSRKRGDSNKRVSNLKLRSLGWVPRYPSFEEAMRKSILPSFQITIR